MTFANFSPFLVAFGLLALAGGLYALQQLRVRYREIRVPTTLFWREAMEEAPVRIFRQRFRHPLAYLLILAISGLIWLAIAGPTVTGDHAEDTHYVLMLDGSASAARGNAFEEAVADLKRDAARLPKDSRTVLWVGAETHTLLAPGEQAVLLDRRIENKEPISTPNRLQDELQTLAMLEREGQATTAIIYGNAVVHQADYAAVSDRLNVFRAQAREISIGNSGLIALGIGEPASGRWTSVDVRISAASDDGSLISSRDLQLTLNGAPLEVGSLVDLGQGNFIVRNVPATGGLFSVQLVKEDLLSFDNVASIQLPNRPMIRVALSPSLGGRLKIALQSDPAVSLVMQSPDIIIRRAGESFGQEALEAANAALFEFTPMADQGQAFLLTYPADSTDNVLMDVVEKIGLNQIDSTAIATAAARPVEVAIEAGEGWTFSLWEELLTEEFNFVQSRRFPLFISGSVRWLSEADAWVPYIAAGQPLNPLVAGTSLPSFTDEVGNIYETLGVPFTPMAAGELMQTDGGGAWASLIDEDITLQADTSKEGVDLAIAEGGMVAALARQDLITWILLMVLALLAGEWFLFQRGRMP